MIIYVENTPDRVVTQISISFTLCLVFCLFFMYLGNFHERVGIETMLLCIFDVDKRMTKSLFEAFKVFWFSDFSFRYYKNTRLWFSVG
ncbi:MAG: hypothetical protein ETSY1_14705 [Candidatus Entotheonella factor]|uniref:Uncharacterized protein n=1 Tax=Entotheonella factor TaxID=1429438 RepID=W4LQ07_ENTF1|nr:MAG: hypothetical protein ETSY1_14705 [Candidatus Entotheonella factor]